MRIAVLGPNTFTELAALKYKLKYSRNSEIIPSKNIPQTLYLIREGRADRAIVPIENLLEGTIRETIDNLPKLDLKILAEFDIPIHHCLAKHRDTLEIKTILSNHHAINQCSEYLNEHYSSTEIKEVESTGEAMKLVAEKKVENSAAIGHIYGAEFYGLEAIAVNIEDNHDNKTIFAIVGKNGTNKKGVKTSILITPYQDYPRLLHYMIKEFAERDINLLKIESRPTGKKMGEYMFYLDLTGDKKDKNIEEALEATKKYGEVKMLGSYNHLDIE